MADERPTAAAAQPGPTAGEGAAAPPHAKAVAIFDLDGTLVVGQTQVLLVKFLRKERVVSRAFVIGTALWFLAYKAGLVKVTQASREKGAAMLAGLSEAKVRELMARLSEQEMVPRLHPAVAAALAEHVAEGDHVMVVSAALDPLVKALCDHLGVSDFAGAPCEVVDGRFTGRLVGAVPYGPGKADVAAKVIAERGADPADCWAYADHDTDLDLLRCVGHPVAVNPRPGLRAEAERLRWPILLSPEYDSGGTGNG